MEEEIIKRLLDLPTPPLIGHIVLIGLAVLAVIDWWSGVKYQPIRTALKWLGKQMNADLTKRVEGVRKELTEHIRSQDDDNAEYLRMNILSFSSSLSRGEAHSQTEFENIMRVHDRYAELCEKIGKKNGYTDSSFEFIQREYQRRLHCGAAPAVSDRRKYQKQKL